MNWSIVKITQENLGYIKIDLKYPDGTEKIYSLRDYELKQADSCGVLEL